MLFVLTLGCKGPPGTHEGFSPHHRKAGYLQQKKKQKHKSRESTLNNKEHVKILITFKPQDAMPVEVTPSSNISAPQETLFQHASVVS